MRDLHFPPRELAVMSSLWKRGRATVAEVRADLHEDLAYTTVLSALQTLEEKGYVSHVVDGRAYRYFALVPAEHAGGSALERIRKSIFQGSASRLFAQLVADRSLSPKELELMKATLLARLKQSRSAGSTRGGE